MNKCKLCQNELKGMALTCSMGSICMKCSEDINAAEYQPMCSTTEVLWILAETFFRRGKGEETSFKQVWNEQGAMGLKLVEFNELLPDEIKEQIIECKDLEKLKENKD